MLNGKNVLVIDDEEELRNSLRKLLVKEGINVFTAPDCGEAQKIISHGPIDIIICDLVLPKTSGIDFLKHIKKNYPGIEVIIISAHGTIEKAVEAIKENAYDFITKPFKKMTIINTLVKAVEKQNLERENLFLKTQLDAKEKHRILIGKSDGIKQVHQWIKRVAPINSTVLITGESGTGKELVARAIHKSSQRHAKPFVAINCGAIHENLIESELFGHVRGAFTGAIRDKEGLFKTAHESTLFLDEIANIPVSLQIKLLRVLEEREIQPVGSTTPFSVDVRIIAATNKDLNKEIEKGLFREDLYYRLNVVGITIPPLNERKADIPELVHFFIEKHNHELGKNIKGIDNETMEILIQAPWKGNVRELDNVIERAIILCDQSILTRNHLPHSLKNTICQDIQPQSLKSATHKFEHDYILEILNRTSNDKEQTAKFLGLSQSSLYRKLSELGIPTHLPHS